MTGTGKSVLHLIKVSLVPFLPLFHSEGKMINGCWLASPAPPQCVVDFHILQIVLKNI